MRKPRICYVNPPVLLKRPVSELINKLSQKGYKTSLLIPKKLFRKRDVSLHHSKLVEKSKIHTYSTINPPFLSSEQPLPLTPMFCINTFRALKNNDIIHVWVPYYLTSLKIILMKKVFFPKKKLILTMDTVPGYSFSMGKFWDAMFKTYNKLFGWLIFKTPDIITLYGKSMIPYALRAGIPKQKIRVIPTGIELEGKKPSPQTKARIRRKIKKELNIKPRTKIVLYAGLLIPRKGINKIISIADKLRKEDVVFLLAGDGPKRKEYEKQVKKKKLGKKVLFLGWRTDIHKLYQASDTLLLPSEGEGLPGVVMEAMSQGLPSVCSNIPCIPDLIDNNKNGFLCNK
ncbi:MAG TPA: glycosyltransferase, partial [Candidatus Woesearchaeota archaeon]|nr:glycosyltransferase [Candidatus Woesearchaeota archaeon]